MARAGDGEADLQQALERGPLPQLGTEDRCLGLLVGGPQQLLERVRGGPAVVVEQPDPLALHLGHRVQGVGDGLGIARRAGQLEHGLVVQEAAEQVGAAVLARRVDGDGAVDGAGLGLQALEDRRQPPGPVMADEEHCDGHRSTLARAR